MRKTNALEMYVRSLNHKVIEGLNKTDDDDVHRMD